MLRDVFYYGKKPNVHPREKFATSLKDARSQCTTEHFWIINEYCDYQGFDWDFDFEFLPDEDVWAEEHNNVWPSQHQKDSGTWLCSSEPSEIIIYRADVSTVKRKNVNNSNWVLLDLVDETKFDFSWHPDPTEPPYIYTWGCKFFPVELQACLEYHTPGATTVKYMNSIVELLPETERWIESQAIDKLSFDMSWRPSPLNPPMNYVWGNKYIDGRLLPTLEYRMPGATDTMYMPDLISVLPEWERWVEVQEVNKTKFDFSWRPDPREPAYIYTWGNKYIEANLIPTLEYHCKGATERKYMSNDVEVMPEWHKWEILHPINKKTFDFTWRPDPREPNLNYVFGNEQYDSTKMPTIIYKMESATDEKHMPSVAKLLPHPNKFEHLEDSYGIDYSWVPDPTSPPYIYVWGNQWNKPEDKISIQYVVEGATEYKYMEERATRRPCKDYWVLPSYINTNGFDFSWEPSPADPPYIYQFGTQWQKTGGPRYVVEGATEVKYIDIQKVKALPNKEHWEFISDAVIADFDYSWHPDETDEAFIYVFGNNQYPAEIMPTLQYVPLSIPRLASGKAIGEIKYVNDVIATLGENKSNWLIPDNVIDFDYSWVPNPKDPPFIYEFGTQWHDRGGPKYIPSSILKLSSGKPIGQIKYVSDIIAILGENKSAWNIPDNIDITEFDFSWFPHPDDPPYIYQFGTQWQKTGGPRYVVEGATEVKYIDNQKAKALPDMIYWEVIDDNVIADFDYSWHPDDTDDPYIYVFGNNQYPAEIMPTVQYVPKNTARLASGKPIGQIKYVNDVIATLGDNKKNWIIPDNIDVTDFDFSWVPDPHDDTYIYQFGTQWQKTGGPQYILPSIVKLPTGKYLAPIKYVDTCTVKALPNKNNFEILVDNPITNFDYSWHSDNTDDAFIYVFGNNQYPAEIMPTIQYVPMNAVRLASGKAIGDKKYVNNVVATLGDNKKNWIIPDNIDATIFDFSWVPHPHDDPYIYEFGTQWQKTGGPKYIMPGATETKYIDNQKVKSLLNKNKFNILNGNVVNFDYSWHPDDTEEPYIYVFGNNQYPAEIMPTIEYVVPGATQIKYVNNVVATLGPNKTNWKIIQPINENKFDFSWVPNPKDPPYTYVWGNKYISNLYKHTIEYHVEGATEIKYMDELVEVLPELDRWVIPTNIDDSSFDYTWRPDPLEADFIWQFGTQWQKTGGPRYIMPGATEVKYIDTQKAKALPNMTYWEVIDDIVIAKFDYSWHHDETDEPYIYVFGNNQYPAEIMPTIQYVPKDAVRLASGKAIGQEKYVNDIVATLGENKTNWVIPKNVIDFDFSWVPNPKDPPFIYEFGTQWHDRGGPKYIPSSILKLSSGKPIGQIKYVADVIAKLGENKSAWNIPENIDTTGFDFSWVPHPDESPYIYQFGTQWQKTGGPKYIVKNATETKYVDIQKAKALPNKNNFEIFDDNVIVDFDYSWHPDDTDDPYIYVFGNNQYPAEIMPTIQYVPESIPRLASGKSIGQIKYVNDIIAKIGENRTNWNIPDNIDTTGFDFSWVPNPKDPPFIYEFGTQWQKTGGPRYIVENATETKYVDIQKAKALPNKNNFEILDDTVVADFDYSWHPDDTDELFIYVFGNNQYPAEIMPTIQYVPESIPRPASGKPIGQIKYVNDIVATLGENKTNWVVPDNIDTSEFDFSWVPNPKDPAYIYQFGTQWQKTGGPRYIVEGATETKYIDGSKAKILPNKTNFTILDNIVVKDFDYSWHPADTDEQYIYVFGNNQYPAEVMPTIQYVPESIQIDSSKPTVQVKYVNDIVATLGENKSNWIVPENVDTSEFDFSWVPDPHDDTYIYQFGTQWQKTGGPQYILPTIVKLSTGKYLAPIKYIDAVRAKALVDKNNWVLPPQLNILEFDFSWHPDSTDDPYIYEFGTQWHDRGGPKYIIKGATDVKYITTITATLGKSTKNWEIPDDVDTSEFDFSWVPHPNETPYIYQFGTQHQKTGGPKYIVKGAIEIKYIDVSKAKKLPSKKYWFNPNQADTNKFDYSWHPDETAPPYIYQFGTLLDKEDGPRYMTPNSNGEIIYLERIEAEIVESVEILKTFPKYVVTRTLEDLIKEHPNELFWALNPDLDYSEFDFEWRPSIEQSQYVHAFGSSDSETTQTYLVNSTMWEKGFKELNWVVDKKLDDETLFKLFKKSDMFFVDRSNDESKERFEKLKQQFPTIQKTRYLNSWVETITRCINRSTTDLCWILNSELDYTNFNFEYYPNPWQMKMVHVFGTQWNHWGTTFMVNRETFAQDTKHIKIIEHLSNLNFVKDRKAKATNILYDIVYIDHGNKDMSSYKQEGKLVIKYQDSYINTLQRLLDILPVKKEHYIWIASTVCDYTDFDFTYICDPFAKDQLHVFPSDRQPFGDTFLVDVNKLRLLIEDMNTLEDYEKINYNQSQRVKRLPAPVIVTKEDTHINSINTEFSFPYAVFITEDNKDINIIDNEPMSLWAPESKNIQITSVGGTRIVVPKEAKDYVKRELYDYPYIMTNSKLAKSNPLDIVFFSNGETSAESNYEHLLKITQGLPNKVTRIDGVSGRVKSQHAAAESSTTQWYFLVNAKLKVNSKFDFNWQPDRLQVPKHYIFHASNPVNGLKYGHQAIVANNKKLTLENYGNGLDFTMDSEHEIIKINSGFAMFNTSAWDTWRTAFRECIKLKASSTDENKERLEMWLTVGMGEFNEYSMEGAQHAVEYYEAVNGDFDKLKLSYDWPWLKEKFNFYYNI